MAEAKLPRQARIRSWVRSSPSTLTEAACSPAAFISAASAGVTPRPPVVRTGRMPAPASAATTSRKPGCRYASPPISTTSRAPAAASCSTTFSAASVESSVGRGSPAREPQCVQG